MWKIILPIGLLIVNIFSTPIGLKKKNMAIKSDDAMESSSIVNERSELALRTLNLPSNATSIRSDLVDNFSCEDKGYGYYADIDNDCQIFHVCLPVVYPDGKENLFRWSFICPEETVFSQDSFTCMREEDMAIGCEDSVKYYELNRNFGIITESNEVTTNASKEDDIIVGSSESKMNENEKLNKIEVVQNVEKKPLNSYKKKPVRRPELNQKQPIKKIQTTTMKVMEINEFDVVAEKEMEKTTNNKYQKLTKRTDLLNNNQKNEQTKLEQKKKLIPQQVTLNTKRIEIPENSRITNIIEQQKQPQINIVTESIIIETKIPVEINKNKDEIKIPLEKLKKTDEIQETSLIKSENFFNNYNAQVLPLTIKATEISILNNDNITESVLLLKNQEHNPIKEKHDQKSEIYDELLKKENLPIKEDEIILESMNEDNNANNNNNNNNKIEKDQQSMIINLISSLVNAENSKVEKNENENKMGNLDNKYISEETDINLNTSHIPEIPVKNDESLNLKEYQNEDKLKSELNDQLVKIELLNNDNNNMKPIQNFDQMSHIPVKIILDDSNFIRSESILNDNFKEKIIETTLATIEASETNNKDELVEEIIENSSMSEQHFSTEIIDNESVTVKANEILPIFFRTNQDKNLKTDLKIIEPIQENLNDQIVLINQSPLNINTNIDNLNARKFRNQMDSRKRRFLFTADATRQ